VGLSDISSIGLPSIHDFTLRPALPQGIKWRDSRHTLCRLLRFPRPG